MYNKWKDGGLGEADVLHEFQQVVGLLRQHEVILQIIYY